MKVLHLLVGYEGSVNDARLWAKARTRDLRIPERKFYVGDF